MRRLTVTANSDGHIPEAAPTQPGPSRREVPGKPTVPVGALPAVRVNAFPLQTET